MESEIGLVSCNFDLWLVFICRGEHLPRPPVYSGRERSKRAKSKHARGFKFYQKLSQEKIFRSCQLTGQVVRAIGHLHLSGHRSPGAAKGQQEEEEEVPNKVHLGGV